MYLVSAQNDIFPKTFIKRMYTAPIDVQNGKLNNLGPLQYQAPKKKHIFRCALYDISTDAYFQLEYFELTARMDVYVDREINVAYGKSYEYIYGEMANLTEHKQAANLNKKKHFFMST